MKRGRENDDDDAPQLDRTRTTMGQLARLQARQDASASASSVPAVSAEEAAARQRTVAAFTTAQQQQQQQQQKKSSEQQQQQQQSSGGGGVRVMLDAEGRLVLDESSLRVAASTGLEGLADSAEPAVFAGSGALGRAGSSAYSKRGARAKICRWSVDETERFYRALRVFGTDFSLIAGVFAAENRDRRQIKAKFKKEERDHPDLIDKALSARIPLDEEKLAEAGIKLPPPASERQDDDVVAAAVVVPSTTESAAAAAPATTEENEEEKAKREEEEWERLFEQS